MKILEFVVKRGAELKRENPKLRHGQAAMSALFEIDSAEYTRITGTDLDPFYLDSKLPEFYLDLAEINGEYETEYKIEVT